jgi:hypothetical protein
MIDPNIALSRAETQPISTHLLTFSFFFIDSHARLRAIRCFHSQFFRTRVESYTVGLPFSSREKRRAHRRVRYTIFEEKEADRGHANFVDRILICRVGRMLSVNHSKSYSVFSSRE